MSFKIVFEPPLELLAAIEPPDTLEGVQVPQELRLREHSYSMSYKIHDRTFSYAPANILTILNDIYLERDLIASLNSHMMRLSGYPVVGILIERNIAQFYEAVRGTQTLIPGAICIQDVLDQLQIAAKRAWSEFIRTQQST